MRLGQRRFALTRSTAEGVGGFWFQAHRVYPLRKLNVQFCFIFRNQIRAEIKVSRFCQINNCELKNSAGWISEPPCISAVFVVQTHYIKRFCTIAKKMRLDTRIRMHRSRASGASNLSRYGRFCEFHFVRLIMSRLVVSGC